MPTRPSYLLAPDSAYNSAALLSPRAAALPDLILGVVATKCALANSIYSLKLSNSENERSKSINGSSIWSFLSASIPMNLSIEKSWTFYSSYSFR